MSVWSYLIEPIVVLPLSLATLIVGAVLAAMGARGRGYLLIGSVLAAIPLISFMLVAHINPEHAFDSVLKTIFPTPRASSPGEGLLSFLLMIIVYCLCVALAILICYFAAISCWLGVLFTCIGIWVRFRSTLPVATRASAGNGAPGGH